MLPRPSRAIWNEFKEYIKDYEKTHGVQGIDSIRRLARGFAGTKSPLDDKAAQPIYWTLFTSICLARDADFPADFNFDNYYDPDGLYPNDRIIQKKLQRKNKRVENGTLELIRSLEEDTHHS